MAGGSAAARSGDGQPRKAAQHGGSESAHGASRSRAPLLPRSLDLAARWVRSQVALKVALAAGLSWAVGGSLPGISRPYFAPLAAILTVQLTVAETVSRAVQRTVGVVAGVLVALALAHVVGLSAWGIGLLVFASLTLGNWLRLGPLGVSQVAISALLVVIIGSLGGPSYAWSRVVETAVGALVGIAVNLVLTAPSGLPAAERALASLAGDLSGVLQALADDLDAGLPASPLDRTLARARSLDRRAAAARQALQRAEEIVRYSMRGRRERPGLDRLQRAAAALDRAATQVRAMVRVIHDAGEQGWPGGAPAVEGRLGRVLRTATSAVAAYWEEQVSGGPSRSPSPWTRRLRAALREQRRTADALGGPAGWVPLGALLATAHRLICDLDEARCGPPESDPPPHPR